MTKRPLQRAGVTLVELLIIIAIILILMALVLPLINRVMLTVEETKVIREIKLLDQACEQFKATFGRYPPGRILICEDMRGYRKAIEQHLCQDHPMVDPKHQEALARLAGYSLEYIQSIFPGIDLNAGHDWNGDGKIDDRQFFLNGNEAMVFFLGGMRFGSGAVDQNGSNRSGPQGWNTDKTQPTRKTTSTRLGPFFEFDESRIIYPVEPGRLDFSPYPSPAGSPMVHDWTIGVSTGLNRYPGELFVGFFARYFDVWNTPYAFFSPRIQNTNNYTYHYCPFCYDLGLPTSRMFNYHLWFSDVTWIDPIPRSPGTGDWIPGYTTGPRSNPADGTVSSQWIAFVPYIQNIQGNQVKYYHANRFQIVSAGRDKQFGSGGQLLADTRNAELSVFKNFKYISEENIPTLEEIQANYDNITNINFSRVVPR